MGRLIGRMLITAPIARDTLSEVIVSVVSYNVDSHMYTVSYRGVSIVAPAVGQVVAKPGQTAKLLLTGHIPAGVVPL